MRYIAVVALLTTVTASTLAQQPQVPRGDAARGKALYEANKCADCHAVEKSHSSADIAIPSIVDCRACHAGNKPAPNKVVSTCVACHGFHLPEHPPFAARARAPSDALAVAALAVTQKLQ